MTQVTNQVATPQNTGSGSENAGDFIDQIVKQEAATEGNDPNPADAPKDDQAPKTDAENPENDSAEDDVPFPKKAINALSRKDKQIGKKNAEIAQLRQELAAARGSNGSQPGAQAPQGGQPSNPGSTAKAPPKEDDFETFGEFHRATVAYEVEQVLAAGAQKQTDTQNSEKFVAWVHERETAIDAQAAQYVETVPDFAQTLQEFSDVIDEFPAQIERVFLEADDAPLAFYTLAKEGKLEALATMSPVKAAMEIARASDRGQALIKKRPLTNAPAPMTPNKGAASHANVLSENTPVDDMMAFLNS
jgi:hypothetical protein